MCASFALMHECGHGLALFRSPWLNRATGFLLGVLSGMPQYVWSQHHNYHHAHNGNWQKYRGPYTTLSVDEYAALTDVQQRMYRCKCSIAAAPVAGFIYLIVNPRLTWIKGSIGLVIHILRKKIAQPRLSVQKHAASFADALLEITQRISTYVLEQCRVARRLGIDVLGIGSGVVFFDLFAKRINRWWRGHRSVHCPT
jgi:hypothetical protein